MNEGVENWNRYADRVNESGHNKAGKEWICNCVGGKWKYRLKRRIIRRGSATDWEKVYDSGGYEKIFFEQTVKEHRDNLKNIIDELIKLKK